MKGAQSTKRSVKAHIKIRLLIAGVFLIFTALVFNAMLSLSSLEKFYVDALCSSYRMIGKDLQRNIEKSLKFGKNIRKFIGINDLLNRKRQHIVRQTPSNAQNKGASQGTQYIAVAMPDGKILYCTTRKKVNTSLPEAVRINFNIPSKDEEETTTPQYQKHGTTYYISLPIHDRKKNWVATEIIAFDEKQVKSLLNEAMYKTLRIGVIVIGISTFFLVLLMNLILPRERAALKKYIHKLFSKNTLPSPPANMVPSLPKRGIAITLFLILALSQIGFSLVSIMDTKSFYLNICKEKSMTLNQLLKEDVEYLLGKGRKLNRMYKMEVKLKEILSALPEASNIRILDLDGNTFYMADMQGAKSFTTHRQDSSMQEEPRVDIAALNADPYNINIVLEHEKEKKGYIATQISQKIIYDKVFKIVLDYITVLLISMLFSVELLIIIFQVLNKKTDTAQTTAPVDYVSMRSAAFLFHFGVELTISFVPLHMANLYFPDWGISKTVLMGLPISAQVLFTGITLFLAGFWIDRRGWHEPFLAGVFIAALGSLYSSIAPDAIQFIASRSIVGLGYGFGLMASQGFVIEYTGENNKAQGLSQLVAGIFAGSICGGAAGGMLAERIGYLPVFFGSAVLIFSVILFTLFYMRSAMVKPVRTGTAKTRTASAAIIILRFLTNKNVLGMIILSSIPAAIAIVGFINYFTPVYMKGLGVSQSTIGRLFMIYGICLIYIAPVLGKYIDESEEKKTYVFISGLFGSLSFLIFYHYDGLWATALAIFFIGLSSSFGFSSQGAYILKLPIAKELGAGTAMGIFRSATRIGQVLGPMIFGWLIIGITINQGLYYLGIAYILVTLIFFLMVKSNKEIAKA